MMQRTGIDDETDEIAELLAGGEGARP